MNLDYFLIMTDEFRIKSLFKEKGNIDGKDLVSRLEYFSDLISEPFYLRNMGEEIKFSKTYPDIRPKNICGIDVFWVPQKVKADGEYKLVKSERVIMENSGELFKGHQELLPENLDKRSFGGTHGFNPKLIGKMRALREIMFDNATDWKLFTYQFSKGELLPPLLSPLLPPLLPSLLPSSIEDLVNEKVEILVGRLVAMSGNGKISKTGDWIGFKKNWTSYDV
jgi:hypothetical protein